MLYRVYAEWATGKIREWYFTNREDASAQFNSLKPDWMLKRLRVEAL